MPVPDVRRRRRRGLAQEPPQTAAGGGNPVGSRTGGPGGVGPGPQEQQRAPGRGAGDDRCRGCRAVVAKCDRRTRIAPGELLGIAQPDQPSQAERLRHRDRARQRHPGPGRQVLRRQPRGHLQPQRLPVGRRQEDRTREHPRVAHGELQQPVQLRPACRPGGGGGRTRPVRRYRAVFPRGAHTSTVRPHRPALRGRAAGTAVAAVASVTDQSAVRSMPLKGTNRGAIALMSDSGIEHGDEARRATSACLAATYPRTTIR